MKEFISKYVINTEAAMSNEWTSYDSFWSALCLFVGLVGLFIGIIVR